MNSLKKLLPFAVVGVLSGATTFGAIKYFDNNNGNNGDFSYFHEAKNNAQFAGIGAANGEDFVKAAKVTVPAVVTIKNYQNRTSSNRMSEQDLFDQFLVLSEIHLEITNKDKSNNNLNKTNKTNLLD
jgi:hypothetical protein